MKGGALTSQRRAEPGSCTEFCQGKTPRYGVSSEWKQNKEETPGGGCAAYSNVRPLESEAEDPHKSENLDSVCIFQKIQKIRKKLRLFTTPILPTL